MDRESVANERTREAAKWRRAANGVLAAIGPPLVVLAIESFFLSTMTRWLLFIAAVMVSSWLGGLKGGLVATAVSTAIVWWHFTPPEKALGRGDPRHFMTALVFIAIGIAVSIFHEQLKRVNRDLGIALDRARRANDALERTANDRRVFAALIENSSDFIGISDPTGKPLYVNPAGRRMVGLPPDFPVETTQIADYYPPDTRPFATNVILKAMSEQGHWSGETVLRNWRTQAEIPVWDTHFLIDDIETGRIIGMGTITRDISAIRAARDALEAINRQLRQTTTDLKNSQALLQAVFDHTPSAIVVKDLKGTFLLTNRKFQQVSGFAAEELRGKNDFQLLPPQIAELHAATDTAAIESRKPVTIEETYELPDGTHIFLETVFPLQDDEGQSSGVCWIGTDITGIKRSGETLERTAEDLKEAQRVAHIGSWRWEKNGNLTWSEELYRIHGLDPSGPPPSGREAFLKLFTPSSASALAAAIEALTRDHKPVDLELEAVLPDGSNRWVGVRGETMVDDAGQVVGLRGTTQDITQLKHLQKMKEEWTSVIAHDLRQPIGVIKMSAELLPELHKGKATPAEASTTERIRSAAEGLARMVDDLLDISRIETHRLSLERVSVDPRAVVREAVNRLAHVTAGCRVHVSERGKHAPVSVDIVRFDQVLGNLITNAVKYGDKNGDIHVHVEQRESEVEFSVTNKGKGIPAEDLPRVFTRFGRSKAARTSGVSGLGLGLYIAKGLVEAHGGRIWVESVPDKTTTFHFTLPNSIPEKAAA